MKERIYIFLRTDEDISSTIKTTENDRYKIVIAKINPHHFQGFLGQRAHKVYCDIEFQKDNVGKEFISQIAKSFACLKNSEFYYI